MSETNLLELDVDWNPAAVVFFTPQPDNQTMLLDTTQKQPGKPGNWWRFYPGRGLCFLRLFYDGTNQAQIHVKNDTGTVTGPVVPPGSGLRKSDIMEIPVSSDEQYLYVRHVGDGTPGTATVQIIRTDAYTPAD